MTNRFKGSGFTFSTQLFAWVPLQTLFNFSQFFCFFIITLVSEIVKEKLCRYRKYYRANKIGLSRAPAHTPKFYCRKIASLFADFTLYKDIEKRCRGFAPTPLCIFSLVCCSSFIFCTAFVGLRLLRLCLKLRLGLCPKNPQWVSPLDPDQGRVPGPFARFARCFFCLVVVLCSVWHCHSSLLTPHSSLNLLRSTVFS